MSTTLYNVASEDYQGWAAVISPRNSNMREKPSNIPIQKKNLPSYSSVVSASLEVLCDFVIHQLLGRPLDQANWTRKIFKVYKTLNMLEKKAAAQPKMYYKRLFKLVFVLFKLEKGKDIDEIWQDIQMQTSSTTDLHLLGSSSYDGLSRI